ncbi:hypothetical protein CHU98_g7704 [Xylaria longipes]|nr:hypothetical protein CHU98_g7704 [Xylaria longipes]
MAGTADKHPWFEGWPGEDPTEYIEDVEMYAGWTAGDGESNEERATFKIRLVFRKGLRGEGKDWYLNLSFEKR